MNPCFLFNNDACVNRLHDTDCEIKKDDTMLNSEVSMGPDGEWAINGRPTIVIDGQKWELAKLLQYLLSRVDNLGIW